MNQKKFHQVSHDNGQDIKIILANTRYEAIGFYLEEEVSFITADALDRVTIIPPQQKIIHAYNGFNVEKTIEDTWKEKDDWRVPQTVVSY